MDTVISGRARKCCFLARLTSLYRVALLGFYVVLHSSTTRLYSPTELHGSRQLLFDVNRNTRTLIVILGPTYVVLQLSGVGVEQFNLESTFHLPAAEQLRTGVKYVIFLVQDWWTGGGDDEDPDEEFHSAENPAPGVLEEQNNRPDYEKWEEILSTHCL